MLSSELNILILKNTASPIEKSKAHRIKLNIEKESLTIIYHAFLNRGLRGLGFLKNEAVEDEKF